MNNSKQSEIDNGFIRVEEIDGVWWFISPIGEQFLSLGVNHIEPHLWLGSYSREHTIAEYGPDFVLPDGRFNPDVDVLSFQCFGTVENIAEKMGHWANFADRPVLLADAAGWTHAHGDTGWPPKADRNHDTEHYRLVIDALWEIPQCVGYHLCGSHIRNNARRYGFRNHANQLIPETVDGIRAVNADMLKRMTI